MPRGPPPDRMNRRRAPPPPSFGVEQPRGRISLEPPRGRPLLEPPRGRSTLEPPRGRPAKSPRRKNDRSADFQRGYEEPPPPRRERFSPPPPRRRSRSPIGKPRERILPMTPPPPRRSLSPRRSRNPPPQKLQRSKSPKTVIDKSYASSKFTDRIVDDDLLGEKKNSFGSGVMDRSMFRGPEAYTSYDPEEIKKIRIFIRRRLTSSDTEPVAANHLSQDDLSFNHRSERESYREPPKMKRLEENFRSSKDHRGKEMPSWSDHPEPMNMRDAPPPYEERAGPPRDRYRSPPPSRKHDDRIPPRGFERKLPRDDFHEADDHYPPQRLMHDNGRAEFDRRPSPIPYGRGRDEGLRDDRLEGRPRPGEKRLSSGRSKLDASYSMPSERRPSPEYVDPYRRSPVDKYRKAPRGRSMSPHRRLGPPPMERSQNIDRRRDGPPREEHFRSPPRARETMNHPNEMAPRRGRGSRGTGHNYRGGQPSQMGGSPPQRRPAPGRGGFGNQMRRPYGGRK
ncbi:unnamed protein product [Bemisia tabaci]|uniref:Uncharacterized protein n=1 Tax=Bemisia tabaci TaxID=7038 RepID=A0A9P0ABW7_BEMTA|nr:unnamed protein product [Bemisia tabaci]